MWRLSNLSPDTLSSNTAAAGVVVRAALPGEVRPALGLILSAGDREITEFLRITALRGIDLTRFLLAESGGRLLWALLPVETRGKTLQLLSPNTLGGEASAEGAEALIDHVCRVYTERGWHLVQVLIDPSAAGVRELYRRQRFVEMADLIYLQAAVRPGKPAPLLSPEFYFEYYSPATHGLFAEAIRLSYRDSLDCPALAGLRDIDDVIQGHRAAGGPAADSEFDGKLWHVLLKREAPSLPPRPCGVLLLCRIDSNEAMELVYLGLSPEARGRGLGQMLMQQAMADAARDHRRRLTLAVDSRNQPALKLYFRHGFAKVAEKTALLRDLRATGEAIGIGGVEKTGAAAAGYPHVQ